jgi:hypothetical protein
MAILSQNCFEDAHILDQSLRSRECDDAFRLVERIPVDVISSAEVHLLWFVREIVKP